MLFLVSSRALIGASDDFWSFNAGIFQGRRADQIVEDNGDRTPRSKHKLDGPRSTAFISPCRKCWAGRGRFFLWRPLAAFSPLPDAHRLFGF